MKTPEKEPSDEEIDNLSEARFKTLVIRMLTELIELSQKMKEEMKATQSEIKENIQNQHWREGNQYSNQRFGRKGKNKPSTRTEWRKKNSKNEERLRNLQDNFKHSNIRIIGVPEGEEKEQEIDNLFEQIMKENFPNLVKEIDFQEVLEAQRVPKKLAQISTPQGTS